MYIFTNILLPMLNVYINTYKIGMKHIHTSALTQDFVSNEHIIMEGRFRVMSQDNLLICLGHSVHLIPQALKTETENNRNVTGKLYIVSC